jgi:glycosyltransferase involved in cell wall biosynthesis
MLSSSRPYGKVYPVFFRMACELPIVATNVDGAREAITHKGNGFLHEPHDVDAMAESVLKLATDPELRQRMGEMGKSRVMEFDIRTSVAAVESTYQQYLTNTEIDHRGTEAQRA